MKNTMNKRNVAEFHKLLKKDVSYDDIAKYMQIDVKTLKRFSPAVFEKLKKQRKLVIEKNGGGKASGKAGAKVDVTDDTEAGVPEQAG